MANSPPRLFLDADGVLADFDLAARRLLGASPKDYIAKHGRGDDGRGVECLVVELDGTTDRPDGSTYHITWSLGPGRKARESNDVLRERGWNRLAEPIAVTLEPARF